ncbi:DNA methyltransferase [Sphingomonas sp. CLY1604]|uniref:DNA methyltransferase n=1 Tax=Sphingomonas sp. CLY1604 TaxID=3457786 RepID=UPI003FD8A59F
MRNSVDNHLYYGDNLQVLRDHIADASVDLIYLDPPFNSNANYNILYKSPMGIGSDAQLGAFEDTWSWSDAAEDAFDQLSRSRYTQAFELMRATRRFLGENDLMAYLTMMAIRLTELHRVLKPTGSLYLHCDPTASHYLKVLLDGVFGADRFRSEIIWKRTSSHAGAKRWAPTHDAIFHYARGTSATWNLIRQSHDAQHVAQKYANQDARGAFMPADLTGAERRSGDSGLPWRGFAPDALGRHWAVPRKVSDGSVHMADWHAISTQEKLDRLDAAGLIYWPAKGSGFPRFKRYLNEGVPLQSVVVDIPPLNSQARERLGYPTQKPVALLERIVAASSNEGDVVLDPFCGCGTAVHAAQKLGRHWIGIDVTHLAISLIEKRMQAAFPDAAFTVEGTPKDLESARDLARRDKYQFQWWAVSMVDAQPYGGRRKGADGGIDGLIYFKPDGKRTERAIVSVKGGDNVGVTMIRDLHSAMTREGAPIGVFVTLTAPTGPMLKEAAAAGRFEDGFGRTYPRLQIVTIADLFAGKRPELPYPDPTAAFRRAAREDIARQDRLL